MTWRAFSIGKYHRAMRSARAWLQVLLFGIALSDGTGCGGDRLRLGDGTASEDDITGGVAGQGDHTGGAATAGAATSTGGTTGGVASVTGGSPEPGCERGRTRGEEVLWIGDSWITIPGTQYTRVAAYARDSGALGANENYWIEAAPAKGIEDIREQYASRESGSIKVRVLIMNGGTWDTIFAKGSDASVTKVVATFEQLLDEIESDGTVEHIVYFLQPELPTIPGVAKLRPGLMQLCEASSVPCYFVDLEPLWEGNEDAYTDNSGVQASEAGARVIADAIWQVMQENCIAQ
jgi:hypothetical protein